MVVTKIWHCPGGRVLSVPKNLKGEGTLLNILNAAGIARAKESVSANPQWARAIFPLRYSAASGSSTASSALSVMQAVWK